MEQRNHKEFNQRLQKLFLDFTVAVFQFLEGISNPNNRRIIAYQLGKSASSSGANFRAFCKGKSKNEEFAKICIVVEEVDESKHWLMVLERLQMSNISNRTSLLKEVNELVRFH